MRLGDSGVFGAGAAYAGLMAMDCYYTDRVDKYTDEKGVYHVLLACPKGVTIKEKHRVMGMPPADEHRHPCEACLAEITHWLRTLPEDIRPTQYR